MDDVVTWPDDGNETPIPEQNLQTLLSTLGVSKSLAELYRTYFEETKIGAGDVFVFQPAPGSKNVFAIDMYRDLTDQMDIVTFSVGCSVEIVSIVREKLRAFFDGASCQVHYEEANHSTGLHRMLDVARYPIIIGDSGYKQAIHYVYG